MSRTASFASSKLTARSSLPRKAMCGPREGIGEDLENVGSTVAIMRIIDLIPA